MSYRDSSRSHSGRDSPSLRFISPSVTLNDFQRSSRLLELYQLGWTQKLVKTLNQPMTGRLDGLNDSTGHIHTGYDLDLAIRPCFRNNTLKAACL